MVIEVLYIIDGIVGCALLGDCMGICDVISEKDTFVR